MRCLAVFLALLICPTALGQYYHEHSGVEIVQVVPWPGQMIIVQTAPRVTVTAGPHWTYPGRIQTHLLQGHGVSAVEVAGLTRGQMEALHDSLHNSSRGVVRSRTVIRTRRRLFNFWR